MKKLFYTFGAALVMLASVSCEKKETVKETNPSVDKAEMTFTATSEKGALKTTVKEDGTTVVWSGTDDIMVYSASETGGVQCPISTGAGTTYAEFTGQCSGDGPWSVICPSTVAKSFSDGVITFTMPAVQTYAGNTFASGAMPCIAYSETTELSFNHLFGVLKLQLLGEGSVKRITVVDKTADSKLYGTFTVKPSEGVKITKLKMDYDGTNAITLDCGESGVALNTGKATDFWFVVPAGAFASGFDVNIVTIDGKYGTLSTNKPQTIVAGQINPMSDATVTFSFANGFCDEQYPVVGIGGQIWLRENMRCNKYNDGSLIPSTKDYTGGYKPYYDDAIEKEHEGYGYLYSWSAAMKYTAEEAEAQMGDYVGKRQGICPTGFHIPSHYELEDLWFATVVEYGDVGTHLKSNTGWIEYTGDNASGFSALPAGCSEFGYIMWVGYTSTLWSSDIYTEEPYLDSHFFYTGQFEEYGDFFVGREDVPLDQDAYSVRCVKD